MITRDLTFAPTDDVDDIARTVREYLGVPLEVQFAWADANIALKNWRRAFFEAGVYVFKDQFRAEGFSGFCLYHNEFPIIYVNNTTTTTRQIFTLFHELAHLLFHTSGVDTPNDDYIEALPRNDRQIEVICNLFCPPSRARRCLRTCIRWPAANRSNCERNCPTVQRQPGMNLPGSSPTAT